MIKWKVLLRKKNVKKVKRLNNQWLNSYWFFTAKISTFMEKYGKIKGSEVYQMINFIICDDEEIFRDSIKEKIDSCMMKSTAEYKTYFFSCYDEKFFKSTYLR